jgi:hypothetical protein
MAFSAEVHVKKPLLSLNQENYDTLNVQGDHDSEVAIRTETIGEDQPKQEVLSGPASGRFSLDIQTLNEPRSESQEDYQQRRKCSKLTSSALNSTKPLKYLAIAFGLWSELGRWSLGLIVPIAISLLPADVLFDILINVQHCSNSSGKLHNEYGMVYCQINNIDSDHCVMLIVEVSSYLVMVYCIRRSSKRTKVLQLPKAFDIVKNSKRVNLLLLVSLSMIITSTLMRKCCCITCTPPDYNSTMFRVIQTFLFSTSQNFRTSHAIHFRTSHAIHFWLCGCFSP